MNMQTNATSELSLQEQIKTLENSVDDLVSICIKMHEENSHYKKYNEQLMRERSELQTKNSKAIGQVEAMVDRLKSLDKAS